MTKKSNIAEGEFFVGADKVLRVTLDAGVDIATWDLNCLVRLSPRSTANLITKTTPTQITKESATVFRVVFDSTDTAGLTPGKYYYECWRTDIGSKDPLVYGTLPLSA